MGYCYLNVHISSVNDELICELLVRHSKKLAYLVEYLRMYWTNFSSLFTA